MKKEKYGDLQNRIMRNEDEDGKPVLDQEKYD